MYDANVSFRRPAPGLQVKIAEQSFVLRCYPVSHARSSVYTNVETGERQCPTPPLQTCIRLRFQNMNLQNEHP